MASALSDTMPINAMKTLVYITVGLFLVLGSGCGLFGDIPDFQGEGEDADTSVVEPDSGDADVNTDVNTEDTPDPECTLPSDCPELPNTEADCQGSLCTYTCEDGFVDLDGDIDTTGCECEITPEVCDGTDNNCDGIVDNAFGGGDIAAGGKHTCATTENGDLYCWGDNAAGQLGQDEPTAHSTPTRLSADFELAASSVTAGGEHTCIINAGNNDRVYCWGSNEFGQLGLGDTEDQIQPSFVEQFTLPATAIAAGSHHSCALDVDNQAFCWGQNASGQLGAETTDDFATQPTLVAGSLTIRDINTGLAHSCALTTNGSAWCWGDNTFEQLGVAPAGGQSDTIPSSDTPVRADSSKAFADVAVSAFHSCGRQTFDAVTCWGGGDHEPRSLTGADTEPVEFVAISANGATVCGLDADGNAHCLEQSCQIDTDENVTCETEAQWREIPDLDLIDLSVGAEHTCALSQDGRAYCWGSNSSGQLGNGSSGGTASQPVIASCN